MKLFHVRFGTESGDRWSVFVKASSEKEVENTLREAEEIALSNMKDVEDVCNNCDHVIELVKTQSLSKLKKEMIDVYEQEIE